MSSSMLPFDNDEVVIRSYELNRTNNLNDEGLVRFFFDKATAETEQGVPLNFSGHDQIFVDVPADLHKILTKISPSKNGCYVFKFRKLTVLPSKQDLANASLHNNLSPYVLSEVCLG